MISFLIGKIHKLSPLKVHLNVQGTGYEVHTTLSTIEKLGALSRIEDVILYTRVYYAENSQSIYGFLNEHEVDLFDFLINLHGIGPKIVMSILSYCNIEDFLKSLENGNSEILMKVPGIGKSKAEKILFEAKNKQKKLENIIGQFSEEGLMKEASGSSQVSSLLLESLETLGFNRKEVALAEKKVQMHESGLPDLSKDTIQLWIRTYLKYL